MTWRIEVGHCIEQMEAFVDPGNESHPTCQGMEQSNSTTGNGVRLVGDFVVDVAGSETGLKCNRIV